MHPLDPLTASEIRQAVAIAKQTLNSNHRFPVVVLKEPPKTVVTNFVPGQPISREVLLVMQDNQTGKVSEATVSLNDQKLTGYRELPNVQPRITADEVAEAEQVVKQHPDLHAALAKRGITDLELVMIDPWAAGYYGIPEEEGIRLARGLVWLRTSPHDNAYAHPVDGIIPVVDLNKMTVIRIEDLGIVPVPPENGNYAPEFIQDYRQDLRPLEIKQPEGPSFRVDGYLVEWQKWQFRVGFTPREGLVLHQIGYQDGDRLRPIIYRASLAEMVVPYGDPRYQHFRKNAFDVGEHGVGSLANSLTLGCDCLGHIHYFDAVIPDSYGELQEIKNAICLHEEDYGLLWKHRDWRIEQTETRRSRRLVISFITTVDNYEYGFYWYFYQDGSIQYEVKLTGILLCGALADTPDYGTLVAPQLNALNHQHFFCMRLHMSVDGDQNSVYEVNTTAVPRGEKNPHGNAFVARSTLLATEQAAQRLIDPLSGRYWKITNPNVLNRLGQPVAYKLLPGENILPFADPESSIMQRAGFMAKHLWVTPFHPQEMFPAGDYPNQHPGGDGLPRWTQADRNITNTDIVVWYNFGHHHIPRPEDWPIMPISYIGFKLLPVGFFDRNPSLDVPPSPPKCH
jgi:primary-amine oxidase